MKKNEKGAALILVIMFMVVVLVLGAALLSTSLADAKHAIRNEDTVQANYLARSAVDQLGIYIIAEEKLPFLDATELNAEGRYERDYGEFEIVMVKVSDDRYKVQATGFVGDVSSTVSLTIARDTPKWVLDHAIYTVEPLNISSMGSVIGDIGSAGSVIVGKASFSGNVQENLDKPMPLVEVSFEWDGGDAELYVENKETVTLDTSSVNKYAKIEVKPGGTLILDSGNGVLPIGVRDSLMSGDTIIVTGDGVVELYVYDYMELKGNVVLEGTTKLTIYVAGRRTPEDEAATFDLWTPITVSEGEDDPDRVVVYLAKDATMQMQAGGSYSFYIIGPEADIIMQASNVNIYGAVLGNFFAGNNSLAMGEVYYHEPDDTWVIEGAGLSKRFYTAP